MQTTPQNTLPPDYDYSQCFGIRAFSCKLEPECYLCDYIHACDWAANAPNPDSGSGNNSYERSQWNEKLATSTNLQEEEVVHEEPEYTRRDLVELLSFLLRMDEYTLKLAADALTGNTTTVVELAHIQGVSRQAVHQKLERAVKKYPEIRELLLGNLYRCRRIVREKTSEAQRHSARGTSIQNKIRCK